MSRLGKLLIIISACAVAGCAPIGNIGTADYDSMWTVPYRVVYTIPEWFIRQSDLSVFASYHGTMQSIPVEKVKISIIENPRWSDTETPLDVDRSLTNPGRKIIVVRYGNLSARYSIEVQRPLTGGGGGGGNNGAGGDGGNDGVAEWWDGRPL
jgi:hypothetical protein